MIPLEQPPSTITDWIDVEDPGVHYRVMPIDDTQNETEEIPLSPVPGRSDQCRREEYFTRGGSQDPTIAEWKGRRQRQNKEGS